MDNWTQVYTERISYTDRCYYEVYASEVYGVYENNQMDVKNWMQDDECGGVLENIGPYKAYFGVNYKKSKEAQYLNNR